jgi:cytochrome c oxidase cbb3-type subunit III
LALQQSEGSGSRAATHSSGRWRLWGLLLLALAAVILSVWIHRRHVAEVLLRTDPTAILRDPALVRRAAAIGRPQYEQHCATCHGAQLQGDPKRGVPDLARNAWVYGNDPVDVERTILYGIRSGHPESRNLTDMPALVRTGQITTDDAHDVVEYLLSLAGKPNDEAAALRGRSIYNNKGNCYDCHANDARGVVDYGTPALTGPLYLYGGDRQTLYESVLNGRHGKCPAWTKVLSAVQVRALAIYLVTAPRSVAATRH